MTDKPSGSKLNTPLILALSALAAATAVQLAYFLSAPIIVTNDSVGYIRAALGLAASGTFDALEPVRTPGYPIFLAGVFALFGHEIAIAAVAQHLLIALLASVTFLVLRTSYGNLCALLVSVFISLDPFLALYGQWILSETLFCLLLTIAALLALSKHEKASTWMLSGLLFGAACLCRPNALIAAACTAAVLLATSDGEKQFFNQAKFVRFAFLCFGLVIMLGPWVSYRLAEGERLGLARNQTAFLRVQMLQHQLMFDPELIEEEHLREFYFDLKQRRERQSAEEKLHRLGFAFVFRSHLLESMSDDEVDSWYRDYIERYMSKHPHDYYRQAWQIFLNLIHLRSDYPTSLLPATRYILGEVPLAEHIAAIGATAPERTMLYRPKSPNTLSRLWTNCLTLLSRFKPLLSVLFLGLCFITAASQLLRGELKLLFYLPLLIFLTQAAAYAWLLHLDDRYTLVLNPILYIQTALALHYWRKRCA